MEEVEEQGRMSDGIVDNSKLTSSGGEATCIKVEPEDKSITSVMFNRKCQDSDVKEVIVPKKVVCSPSKTSWL